jgi:hypothetical protein
MAMRGASGVIERIDHFRFWHKADMPTAAQNVSIQGEERTYRAARS